MHSDHYYKYYNSSEIWSQSPSQHQMDIGSKILETIPLDVRTILDVGCGNGVITNRLADSYDRVCAVDISEEALKYVKTEKRIGSLDQLPFSDNEFDLILISDVLEHLPPEVFRKGIEELKRVARKYILIVTPFNERLEFGQMDCLECGCHFHVNLHIRRITFPLVRDVFKPFQIIQMAPAGDEWMHLPAYAASAKSLFDYSNDWSLAVCPQCGTKQGDHPDYGKRQTDPSFYSFVGDIMHHDIEKFRVEQMLHNEMIFLLRKNTGNSMHPEERAEHTEIFLEGTGVIKRASLVVNPPWNIDFTNPFYTRKQTVYYPSKPYVLEQEHLNFSPIRIQDGVYFRSVTSQGASNHALFILPKFTDQSYELTIEYLDCSTEEIHLNVYDRNKSYLHLGKFENLADGKWKALTVTVPSGIKCLPEGMMFELTSPVKIQDEHPITYAYVNHTNQEIKSLKVDTEKENHFKIDLTPFKEILLNNNCFVVLESETAETALSAASMHCQGIKFDLEASSNGCSMIINTASELIWLLTHQQKGYSQVDDVGGIEMISKVLDPVFQKTENMEADLAVLKSKMEALENSVQDTARSNLEIKQQLQELNQLLMSSISQLQIQCDSYKEKNEYLTQLMIQQNEALSEKINILSNRTSHLSDQFAERTTQMSEQTNHLSDQTEQLKQQLDIVSQQVKEIKDRTFWDTLFNKKK